MFIGIFLITDDNAKMLSVQRPNLKYTFDKRSSDLIIILECIQIDFKQDICLSN